MLDAWRRNALAHAGPHPKYQFVNLQIHIAYTHYYYARSDWSHRKKRKLSSPKWKEKKQKKNLIDSGYDEHQRDRAHTARCVARVFFFIIYRFSQRNIFGMSRFRSSQYWRQWPNTCTIYWCRLVLSLLPMGSGGKWPIYDLLLSEWARFVYTWNHTYALMCYSLNDDRARSSHTNSHQRSLIRSLSLSLCPFRRNNIKHTMLIVRYLFIYLFIQKINVVFSSFLSLPKKTKIE